MGSLSFRPARALLLLGLAGCQQAPARTVASLRPVAPASCESLIPLVFGTPTRANTRQGHDAIRASCVRGAAPECLFRFDVPQSSDLRVALETNDFDGALALYDAKGVANSPRELRCVDDLPSGDMHHARIDLSLAPGSYLLAVDGANGEQGDFELFAELEPIEKLARACGAATPLVPGVTLRDSTRGGSNRFTATCGGGALGPEHVHSLAIDKPARVRIHQQAEYDGSLYMRAQCEDASSELVCNDDFQNNLRSQIAARVAPGTYYVFSDSYSREQSGDYALSYERFDEPPPVTESGVCSGLHDTPPLTKGSYELDTLYGSAALAGSCGGQGAPELVLPFRIDTPTTLAVRLEDSELNAVVYVRRVCSEAASELACFVAPRVDRPPSELEMSSPALVMPIDRGLYTLVIDGFEATDLGAATLRIATAP